MLKNQITTRANLSHPQTSPIKLQLGIFHESMTLARDTREQDNHLKMFDHGKVFPRKLRPRARQSVFGDFPSKNDSHKSKENRSHFTMIQGKARRRPETAPSFSTSRSDLRNAISHKSRVKEVRTRLKYK